MGGEGGRHLADGSDGSPEDGWTPRCHAATVALNPAAFTRRSARAVFELGGAVPEKRQGYPVEVPVVAPRACAGTTGQPEREGGEGDGGESGVGGGKGLLAAGAAAGDGIRRARGIGYALWVHAPCDTVLSPPAPWISSDLQTRSPLSETGTLTSCPAARASPPAARRP